MKRSKTRRPAPGKLAFEMVDKRDRRVVVTLARFRWKTKHDTVSDSMIRLVRFVWMREPFLWESRHRLHAAVLGRCMQAGLVAREDALLRATKTGEMMLGLSRRDEGKITTYHLPQ